MEQGAQRGGGRVSLRALGRGRVGVYGDARARTPGCERGSSGGLEWLSTARWTGEGGRQGHGHRMHMARGDLALSKV